MWLYKDHPRLCGEKFRLALGDNDFTGSPPPMRGKACKFGLWKQDRRITPAYAGKSSAFVRDFRLCKDHPRLCGEKHNARINRTGHVGSPPPMRGKVVVSTAVVVASGITPAYAGKS